MEAALAFFSTLLALGAIVTPIVVAVVAAVMQAVPRFPTRYKPVVALVVGMVIAVLFALQTGHTWQVGASAGFLSGLAAAGVYSWGKSKEGISQPAPRG